MAGTIWIGTSGWSYSHWRGPFYPQDLPESGWLDFYAGRFGATEINNTFYQLPAAETLAHWRDTVPQGFRFAVKGSRYITHMKKLKDPQDSVPRFLERVDILGDKLGPVLFQLPPNWRFNPDRLSAFLHALPGGYRYTLELRDPSWLDDRAYEILAEHGAAFCIFHLEGQLTPLQVTADFAYVRLHGPDGAYQGSYSEEELAGWAETLEGWSRKGRDVYCFFDNDEAGYAAANAARLAELTGAG